MGVLLGQRLGDYRLHSLLERGNVVDSYLGAHVRAGGGATLKVFKGQLQSVDVSTFQRAMQRIIALIHPHIPRILDFDISGGLAFLVTDTTATSLRRFHPVGTLLPVPVVLAYVRQAGETLQYAHGQGVVHGDLQPGHLLRQNNAPLLVSDLGIEEIARTVPSLQGTGAITTSPYASPEQHQAPPLPASDLYALALMAYEWLSGSLPLTSDIQGALATLREQAPDFPAEAGQVLATALAQDPARRFRSIQAFVNALEGSCSGIQAQTLQPALVPFSPAIIPTSLAFDDTTAPAFSEAVTVPNVPPNQTPPPPPASPIPARPNQPTPWSPPPPSLGASGHLSRRNLLIGLAAGAVGLAALGGGAFAFLRSRAPTNPTNPANLPPTLLFEVPFSDTPEVSWSPDSTLLAAMSVDENYLTTIQVWDIAKKKQIANWRDNRKTIARLSALGWIENAPCVAWNALNRQADEPDDIHFLNLLTQKEISIAHYSYSLDDMGSILDAYWAPDGTRIALLDDRRGTTIRIWNVIEKREILSFSDPELSAGDLGNFRWSPDGKLIVFWSNKGILYVWDTQTGKQVSNYRKHYDVYSHEVSTPSSISIDGIAWSPDSKRIASQAHSALGNTIDDSFHVWSALDGHEICTHQGPPKSVTARLAWSADSSMIATNGADTLVRVWNATTGETLFMYSYGTALSAPIAWSPLSPRIATAGRDDTTVFEVWSARDGTDVVKYRSAQTTREASNGDGKSAEWILWSPNGKLIAVLADNLQIWEGGH